MLAAALIPPTVPAVRRLLWRLVWRAAPPAPLATAPPGAGPALPPPTTAGPTPAQVQL